jgi:8-oxo-dGTP diphosphatase
VNIKKQKENKNTMDVSVDCVLFGFADRKLKVLLIEQKQPEEGKKVSRLQTALPGDLLKANEGLDDAAKRVLRELTSLKGIYLRQFHTFGDPKRVKDLKDQEWLRTFRLNPERRVITVGYYSLVKMDDYEPHASSFAGRTRWVDVYNIPELAFDHNYIVEKGLESLRYGLINENIAFELLPEKFTLSQLQQLHEIILDKKLDKRNFRKNMLKMEELKPLAEKQIGVFHKPAQLYHYKKQSRL